MKPIFDTLLAMLICSGVLYACYAVLLDRRVPFGWCRRYLLAAALLSAVIPLLRIPVWPGPVLTAVPQIAVGAAEAAFEPIGDEPVRFGERLFWTLYGAGCAVVAAAALRQLRQVRRLRRGAETVRTAEYTLVRTPQPVEACSWFRTIFVGRDTPAEELAVIVQHELSHIRHRHSAERCCMEALKALLWWNPFVWLLAARLREAEEYEADRDVLGSGCKAEDYMQLMLKQLLGYRPDITNGLRHSLTKKRLLMMTTNHPHRYVLLRLAGAVPAILGLLCAFSFTTRAAVYLAPEGDEATPQTYTVTELPAADRRSAADTTHYYATIEYPAAPQESSAAPAIKSDDEPLLRAEVMPTYRGGDLNHFRQWAQEQVRYPKAAFEQRIQGRVVASFVIEKDGRVADVQVLASPDRSLSDETVRVLQSSERWEPGRNADNQPVRVKYTLPIDFRLDSAPQEPSAAPESATKQRLAPGSEDLYVRAEQMPRYRGGDLNTFRQWVQLQIRYPQEAREQQLQGRVTVSFVVEKDGSMTHMLMLASPDRSLSDEVVRVLQKAERWEPGRNADGQPVRVKYTLPVDFRLPARDQTGTPPTEAREAAETLSEESGVRIDPMVVVAFPKP